MYTIDKNAINEVVIKNSKFICILYKLNSLQEIEKYLVEVRNIYKDATHYCSAYIFNEYKKSSDDGEPSGTAGMPMLQVLEKNNLNFVLCVVVRYFGGIKLGAGGLVRAYTKCVTEALKTTNLVELMSGYNIMINFSYDKLKVIDYILKDEEIISKVYEDIITYRVNVHLDTLDKLRKINDIFIEIIADIYL